MDLLTSLPPQLPLIVPSTTIREVRHRSLPLHNRLQQLLLDEDRTVWVWLNEESRDTATGGEEVEDESVNDRNDRAIRQTLHYYPEHMSQSVNAAPQLILLSDDKRNRELAIAEGLVAASTRDYVDGLQGEVRDRLVDLVVGGVDELQPGERKNKRIYEDVSFVIRGYANVSTFHRSSSPLVSRAAGSCRDTSMPVSITTSKARCASWA